MKLNLEALVVEAVADGSKPITLTTDAWSPVYSAGDTLLVQPVNRLTGGGHALLIDTSQRVQIGAVIRSTPTALQVEVFGSTGGRVTFLRRDLAECFRVLAVLKA
jgi:hypothetical protein